MSQNSPTLLPSRETGASPSCLTAKSEDVLALFHILSALIR